MAKTTKIKRIIDIVDFSGGFVYSDSDLPVPDAENTIKGAKEFLIEAANIKDGIQHVVSKLDTHFWFEYFGSDESDDADQGGFPNIHCEYNTRGWLPVPEIEEGLESYKQTGRLTYFLKNQFNIWAEKTSRDNIVLTNEPDFVLQQKMIRNLQNFVKTGKDSLFLSRHTNQAEYRSIIGKNTIVEIVPIDAVLLDESNEGFYKIKSGKNETKVYALVDRNLVALYRNLFKALDTPHDRDAKRPSREQFFSAMRNQSNPKKPIEVFMFGHASDFCVHDAIEGYLKRGFKVTILNDLVRGIGIGDAAKAIGRAPSGKIEDVLQLDQFKNYAQNGQLRSITSQDALAEIKAQAALENRPKGLRKLFLK